VTAEKVLVPIVLTAALAMTACPSSSLSSAASEANDRLEAQGLPFRWTIQSTNDGEVMVMHMLPLPVAATRADAHLTGEILGAILRREQSKGRASAELKEVRQMADGREVWILQSFRDGIAYVVTFGNSTQGVTKIGLLGPYSYSQ
jgi:hypothetical protein